MSCISVPNRGGVLPGRQRERMHPGVRRTANEHDADAENLFSIGVGTHIAKSHTGQAGEGKVEGSDVRAVQRRASCCVVDKGFVQTFAQVMEPPLKEEECLR